MCSWDTDEPTLSMSMHRVMCSTSLETLKLLGKRATAFSVVSSDRNRSIRVRLDFRGKQIHF